MSPTPHQPVLKKINLPSPRNNWGEGDSCWPLNRILRWGGVWKRACWLEEGYKFAGPLGASGLSDPLVARAKRKTVSTWGGAWKGRCLCPATGSGKQTACCVMLPPPFGPTDAKACFLSCDGEEGPFITGTPPGWVGFGSLSFKCLLEMNFFAHGMVAAAPLLPKHTQTRWRKGGNELPWREAWSDGTAMPEPCDQERGTTASSSLKAM